MAAGRNGSGTKLKLTLGRYSSFLRLLLPVCGGVLLALLAYRLSSVATRYLVAALVGVSLVSLSMLFLRRFTDYLLVALLFSVPMASFVKYVAGHQYMESEGIVILFSGAIGVGIPDMLLVALYALWFVRIFVTRRAPLPRLGKFDALVLMLVLAHVLSVPGTPDVTLSAYAIIYLTRFVLLYFYVSKNLQRRHVGWLFYAIFFAIFLQAGLGAYQTATGKLLGLAIDRGTGRYMNVQYEVPGIEHLSRATGTTYDSHAYGVYMAMLAPFALVAAFRRAAGAWMRILAAAMLVLAVVGVLISYSRSAWICCAVALAITWIVHLIWGERYIVYATMLIVVVLLILSPWALHIVIERIDETITKHLSARFEQFGVALNIWRDHFVFGYGAGNYMKALDRYNEYGVMRLPVHNVFLWVAAETGLIGVLAFFGIVMGTLARAWRLTRRHRDPACRVAVAAFAAMIAYILDGLTDPLFREAVVYTMFWMLVALVAAMVRIDREATEESPPAPAVERPAA